MKAPKRGRPKLSKEDVRDDLVQIRVTKTEKLLLQLRASQVGMEFAPWLRKKLLDEPIEEK